MRVVEHRFVTLAGKRVRRFKYRTQFQILGAILLFLALGGVLRARTSLAAILRNHSGSSPGRQKSAPRDSATIMRQI